VKLLVALPGDAVLEDAEDSLVDCEEVALPVLEPYGIAAKGCAVPPLHPHSSDIAVVLVLGVELSVADEDQLALGAVAKQNVLILSIAALGIGALRFPL
jgi:hypothetical protein